MDLKIKIDLTGFDRENESHSKNNLNMNEFIEVPVMQHKTLSSDKNNFDNTHSQSMVIDLSSSLESSHIADKSNSVLKKKKKIPPILNRRNLIQIYISLKTYRIFFRPLYCCTFPIIIHI